MNKKIGTTVMLLLATLQVACGKDKKEKAMEAFTQQCNTQACIDMYKNAATNTQIAGLANAQGLPQVAAPGATVLPGQVPSTTILPASVSAAQVSATTAKIQSQITALNAQQAASTSSSSMAPASVSSGPSEVEIGVTRLNSAPVAAAAVSNPSSLQPSSVAAPAPSPAAVASGVGAGQ